MEYRKGQGRETRQKLSNTTHAQSVLERTPADSKIDWGEDEF